MTNFEKLKSMTQDEAVKYLKIGLCPLYENCCEKCPMDSPEKCMSDIFANWLEMEAKG